MSEKHNIVIVFKFIAEGKSARFLEFVLNVADVARIEIHVHSFVAGSNGQIVKIILNVESFSVPLDTITSQMPFLRINERLHTQTVETVVFHQVEHIKFDDCTSFDVCASKIKPLS